MDTTLNAEVSSRQTTVLDTLRRRGISLPAWLRTIGPANLLATAVLVPAGVWLVTDPENRGGLAAAVLIVVALLPLLAMRRFPAATPVAAAVAGWLIQVIAGPLVTCGVLLPLLCAMAFQFAGRSLSRSATVVGTMGLVGLGAVEVLMDPALRSLDAATFVGALVAGFFVGGLLVGSRVRMVDTLRQRTRELSEQRNRTAALAVAADRERIGADLELMIRSRVHAINEAATYARTETTSAAAVRAALAEVEAQGRETLASMRAVVGTLRDAPTEPLPGLGDLPNLIRRATTADARLRIEGETRALGPNVELCAYRIVEQLLATLTDSPLARVEVLVRFTADAVQLNVGGPDRGVDAAGAATALAALTAARTRAEVLGGQLRTAIVAGRRRVEVLLPTPIGAEP